MDGLLGKLHDNFEYEKIFSISEPSKKNQPAETDRTGKNHTPISDEEVVQLDDVVFARLDDYTIFAIPKRKKTQNGETLPAENFCLNAAKAIHNAELREKTCCRRKNCLP